MIKAVSDRVILIPEPVKDQINGIYIPDTSLKKPQRGHVVSVGPDCKEVKVGHEVTFLQGHGVLIDDAGVEKLIITEKDVLGFNLKNINEDQAYFMVTAKGAHDIEISKVAEVGWAEVFIALLCEPFEKHINNKNIDEKNSNI